jgi:hypothetical protein
MKENQKLMQFIVFIKLLLISCYFWHHHMNLVMDNAHIIIHTSSEAEIVNGLLWNTKQDDEHKTR